MIRMDTVNQYYGQSHTLWDLSMEVPAGTCTALIGRNGVGKTTLLKCLMGLLPVRSGRMLFEDSDLLKLPAERRASIGIGYVPQGREIFPLLTVEENLHMGGFFNTKSEIRKSQDHVYELFPRLKEREHQRAGTMSGGEQQMLAIGRALMTNPKLLILDEATEGLAPIIRRQIWDCLNTLKAEGQSILIIDKNVKAIAKLADHHYIIDKGRIVWDGDSTSLIETPDLTARYLGV